MPKGALPSLLQDIVNLFRPDPAGRIEDERHEDAEYRKADYERMRREHRRARERFLLEHPNHPTIQHIVDNRVFLLGLDELYRTRMKEHERTELLSAARAVAAKLAVGPADVPIEGYYYEDPALTEYFRLIRALQQQGDERTPSVSTMREFQRLKDVMSSPAFGEAFYDRSLFPAGRNPLSKALHTVETWSVPALIAAAHREATHSDDFSLVGLACLARDPVVVTALRESVVLYSEVTVGMSRAARPIPIYVWRVDEELARRAARFVATFNALFDENLPAPTAENADEFYDACDIDEIVGRCVCIGRMPEPAVELYHWAIDKDPGGQLVVHEFWDAQLWTTERYRTADHRTNRTNAAAPDWRSEMGLTTPPLNQQFH